MLAVLAENRDKRSSSNNNTEDDGSPERHGDTQIQKVRAT